MKALALSSTIGAEITAPTFSPILSLFVAVLGPHHEIGADAIQIFADTD
jgi:hypothetical protein